MRLGLWLGLGMAFGAGSAAAARPGAILLQDDSGNLLTEGGEDLLLEAGLTPLKMSDFTPADDFEPDDLGVVVRDGVTYRFPLSALATYLEG